MEIDPAALDPSAMYKILIGSIVPRPIAWVSSQDSSGVPNIAPFSYFNAAGSNPPALTVSITAAGDRDKGRKDTLHNILDTGEFVVNIVTEETAVAMNNSATDFPFAVNEFEAVGVTPAPSTVVRPPRITESPVNFECVLHTSVPLGEGPGSSTLIVGLIKYVHVRDDLLDERYRIDIARLQPIGRLAGNSYSHVREIFELVRERHE